MSLTIEKIQVSLTFIPWHSVDAQKLCKKVIRTEFL